MVTFSMYNGVSLIFHRSFNQIHVIVFTLMSNL